MIKYALANDDVEARKRIGALALAYAVIRNKSPDWWDRVLGAKVTNRRSISALVWDRMTLDPDKLWHDSDFNDITSGIASSRSCLASLVVQHRAERVAAGLYRVRQPRPA